MSNNNTTITANNDNVSIECSQFGIELRKLKDNYDHHINSLQSEIDFYKHQHHLFKDTILTREIPRDDNSRVEGNIADEESRTVNDEFNNLKLLSDTAILNLEKQLKNHVTEKDRFYRLWKVSENTNKNLECELNELRRFEKRSNVMNMLRKDLDDATKVYSAQITNLTTQLNQQKAINLTLSQTNKQMTERYKALERNYNTLLAELSQSMRKIKQTEFAFNFAKSEIVELTKEQTNLKVQLKEVNKQLDIIRHRELIALDKVEEVLRIADATNAEKITIIQREIEIKEQYNHLTDTVNEIIEESNKKNELEMSELQVKHEEKIEKYENELLKIKHINDLEIKNSSKQEQQIIELENQLKILNHNNYTLDKDLQLASRTIVEMEIKLKALEQLMEQEKEANRLRSEHCQAFTDFIEKTKNLKEKYKLTVSEMINKLENTILQLNNENYQLKLKLNEKSPKNEIKIHVFKSKNLLK